MNMIIKQCQKINTVTILQLSKMLNILFILKGKAFIMPRKSSSEKKILWDFYKGSLNILYRNTVLGDIQNFSPITFYVFLSGPFN